MYKKCSEGGSGKRREAKSAEFELCRVISYAENCCFFFISFSPQPPASCDFITVKTHRGTERNIYIRISLCKEGEKKASIYLAGRGSL